MLRKLVLLGIGVWAVMMVLVALPVQAAPLAQAGPTATVLVDSLNIRSGPGTNYKVAGSAAKGAKPCASRKVLLA